MFYFVANLKPYTFHRGRGVKRFDAYLLSVDYLKAHRALAKKAVGEQRVLCADNGNVDLIVTAIQAHSNSAEALHDDRAVEETALGRGALPGELSTELSARYTDLAKHINEGFRFIPDQAHVTEVIELQGQMVPTYIVGMEELTLVTMTGLNIERQYTQLPLDWFARSTERAIRFAVDTAGKKFGSIDGEIFAGLHAMDFDSAVQVGRMAAESGVNRIASGLVSAMKDRSFTEYRIAGDQIIRFQRNVPRPYLRTMEIVAGMHLGHAGRSSEDLRFHALGVGTPILLPMIGLMGKASSFTAVDSTAPIKDAHGSRVIKLYTDTPAPRKLSTHKIIEHWLSDGNGWTCECPYCRNFNRQFPYDLDKARQWWRSQGERRLNKGDVRSASPLAKMMPLMCYSPDKKTRRAGGLARIGHNHWVLKRMERKIQSMSPNPKSMYRWVQDQVEVYLSLPGGSPSWKASAEQAWKVTDEVYQDIST